MKTVKVLGTGCANCKATAKRIEEIAAEMGVEVRIEKVEDVQEILRYGVMSTPGVVVDGDVVHAGGIPAREKIAGWLSDAARTRETLAEGNGCCGGKCC